MKNNDSSNLNDKGIIEYLRSKYKDKIKEDCKYHDIEFSNEFYLKLKSTYIIDLINTAIFLFSGKLFLIGAVPFVASMFIHLPKIVNQISLAVTVITFIIVVMSVCFQQIVNRKKMRLLEEVKGKKIFTKEVDKVKKVKIFLFCTLIAVIVILIAWFSNTEIGKSPLTVSILTVVWSLSMYFSHIDIPPFSKNMNKKSSKNKQNFHN